MINEESENTKGFNTNGLKIFVQELGVDMPSVYSKSAFNKFRLPVFKDIYDEYKMQVLKKNMDNSLDHYEKINQHIIALNKNLDFSNMTKEEFKEIDTRNEAELFNYLMEKHYSFRWNKDKIYNSPIKDVW